jgi:hypothetical protein
MQNKTWFVLLLMFLTSTVQAHSGHGRHGGDFSLLHYLSEPEHVVGVALLLALVIGGGLMLWKRHQRSRR